MTLTRAFLFGLAAIVLSAFSLAQRPTAAQQPPTTANLPAGKTCTDSKGRVITNGGTNTNGSLKLTVTGKVTRDADGNLTCAGEVTKVTNPSSQGSGGPIVVNTNGEPTEIDLKKNGTDPGGHVETTVTGGGATINIEGNHNNVNVGGAGNTVNITGNHNSGSGSGPGSSGNVNQGGHGNSWNSGGGTWVVVN